MRREGKCVICLVSDQGIPPLRSRWSDDFRSFLAEALRVDHTKRASESVLIQSALSLSSSLAAWSYAAFDSPLYPCLICFFVPFLRSSSRLLLLPPSPSATLRPVLITMRAPIRTHTHAHTHTHTHTHSRRVLGTHTHTHTHEILTSCSPGTLSSPTARRRRRCKSCWPSTRRPTGTSFQTS